LSTFQELVVVNRVCESDSNTLGCLGEATEYFVVFKFYWFSLVCQLTDSFGASQKIGEKHFEYTLINFFSRVFLDSKIAIGRNCRDYSIKVKREETGVSSLFINQPNLTT